MIIDHPELSVHGSNNPDDDSEVGNSESEDPAELFFSKPRVVHENDNSDGDSEVDDLDNDSAVDDTESEDPEEVLFAKAGFRIIRLHHLNFQDLSSL